MTPATREEARQQLLGEYRDGATMPGSGETKYQLLSLLPAPDLNWYDSPAHNLRLACCTSSTWMQPGCTEGQDLHTQHNRETERKREEKTGKQVLRQIRPRRCPAKRIHCTASPACAVCRR